MNLDNHIAVPQDQIPAWRMHMALQRKVGDRFLLRTWGGLGDQACAEPTLRYAFEQFKTCEISLATEQPELFDHLPFKEVFDLKKIQPHWNRFVTFDTILDPTNLLWQFVSHCVTNAVDFASICAFRCTMPIENKPICLEAPSPRNELAALKENKRAVFIHPGKHWPSKTFPKAWWDEVLAKIIFSGRTPVIIGKDTDDNRSIVDVNMDGCINLHNQTNLKELIWLLKNARALITNDSSPLHLAAAGQAHIGFIASCKHPDYITHWRRAMDTMSESPTWGWRMQNLGRDGIWNYINHNPVIDDTTSVEFLPDGVMEKMLPAPEAVVDYLKKVTPID